MQWRRWHIKDDIMANRCLFGMNWQAANKLLPLYQCMFNLLSMLLVLQVCLYRCLLQSFGHSKAALQENLYDEWIKLVNMGLTMREVSLRKAIFWFLMSNSKCLSLAVSSDSVWDISEMVWCVSAAFWVGDVEISNDKSHKQHLSFELKANFNCGLVSWPSFRRGSMYI